MDAGTGSTWLYDLTVYGVYSAAGGPGLVVAKALVVVGVGLVLLRMSRAGAGRWLAVTCTVLALLAMGTRMLLQPETVSYLLFALVLLIAFESRDGTAPRQTVPLLPPWSLVTLFVVWANVDVRFVLGLGGVALVWVGRTLDETRAAGRSSILFRRSVAWAVLALVCLINPRHVHAFFLPPELAWANTGQVLSPFQLSYMNQFGRSPAGLAYYPLLVLGLLSFVLTLPRWSWQRALPWFAVAVVSALQARSVPFFAIVGGPVLAWNLHDFFALRAGAARSGPRLSRPGRLIARSAVTGLGLAALVSVWPGWLQAPPFEPRRWAVETPPALERSASAVLRWHQEGRLGPQTRTLHLTPDTAHAFAWFCPMDRGVLSARLAPGVGSPDDWAERMRDEGVTHAVVYDPDRGRLFAALRQFLADPGRWPLLFMEGDLAVFGWRDPARAGTADPFRGWELDPNRLAFHPAEDKLAPRHRPDTEPRVRKPWEAFWRAAPPRPIDRDEAALHLLQAEALRESALGRHVTAWESLHAAALVGATGSWTGPGSLLDAQLRLTLLLPPAAARGPGAADLPPLTKRALESFERFTFLQDDTRPAVLYLAVRAARRALAVNPNDAQAHLILGESYLRLVQATRERAWARQMPELFQLRCVQASAALNKAVTLRPELAEAHLLLGQLYEQINYLDLASRSYRAYIDRTREAGPPRGMTGEQFRQHLSRIEEELAPVSRTVQENERAYSSESSGSRVLDRASLAMRKGLAGKARDMLLASDVAAFGPQGMAMELELLIMTGRDRDVRDWMAPEHEASLGEGTYRWMRVLAAAAAGDYDTADEELGQLAGDARRRDAMSSQVALAAGKAILDDRPGTLSFLPTVLGRAMARMEFSDQVNSVVRMMSRRADVTTLRGLMALEAGEVGEAEVHFRLALAYWDRDTRTGVDFNGRRIAQDCLGWLE